MTWGERHIVKVVNVLLTFKITKPSRRAVLFSELHVTSCYAGANQGGQQGEQCRAENEQIQRQRKESKGTSEVRRQRHCVRTTTEAAPTESTRPAPSNPATSTTPTQTAQDGLRPEAYWWGEKILPHVTINIVVQHREAMWPTTSKTYFTWSQHYCLFITDCWVSKSLQTLFILIKGHYVQIQHYKTRKTYHIGFITFFILFWKSICYVVIKTATTTNHGNVLK